MERLWAGTSGTDDQERRSPAEEFALPSRGEAIVALRPVLEAQAGPVLVTGEAGVGKTWLWRRLQAEMPLSWRWVVVDVPPAIDATALYPLIGHGLGLPARRVVWGDRLVLADFLLEATADGIRWALVLDEAHNGSVALLEEIRILANRLGRPDGLSALILVGQTALARRLATRPLNALAARLAANVHLRGLDLDEARALLKCHLPALDWDDRTLERCHRDATGNPRKLLRIASGESITPTRRLGERARVESHQPRPLRSEPPQVASNDPAPLGDTWDRPVIGPIKPPLRVGDGMIEVGWEPDHEPVPGTVPALEPNGASAPVPVLATAGDMRSEFLTGSATESGSGPEIETVETIDDHYAALQAWNELARNRARGEVAGPLESADVSSRLDRDVETGVDSDGEAARGTTTPAGVWIEGHQGFAPYGQLFSRLRQIRDASGST
jgi:type II secretory pathway predicted ATPase ExeA